MPSFGSKSSSNLSTCHPKLRALFQRVVAEYDCSILEGHRPKDRQNQLFDDGLTKVKWPDGKHNKVPSEATDASPWPIPDNWGEGNFKEKAKFYHFAGYVKGVAQEMGITIRWGGDWDSDKDFDDQTFDDLVHFELIE